ncbi:hypothetical protein ACU81Q_15925 [Komagataeibacter melomenusus]
MGRCDPAGAGGAAMMEARQLDLVDYIAGMPAPRATELQVNPLDLLPRRPKLWERMVAHVPAEDVRISISTTWTRVVVEQLREDGRSDLLFATGKIRSDDVPPDLIWPEPCRLILMTAASAARIHERWCLEEAPRRRSHQHLPLCPAAARRPGSRVAAAACAGRGAIMSHD